MFGVVLVVVILLSFIGGKSESPRPIAPGASTLARGREAVLSSGGGSAIAVAVDAEAMDLLTRSATAGDRAGYQSVFLAGRAFAVDQNTKVLVLDPGILTTEVRIMDGSFAGRSGLVPAEWVKAAN